MSFDVLARVNAPAKGKRPAYFDDPAMDRLVSIVMALMGELSVTRERLDTVERLLALTGTLDPAAIDGFTPDRDAALARGRAARELVSRCLRGVEQDMASLTSVEPSIDEVSRQLRDA